MQDIKALEIEKKLRDEKRQGRIDKVNAMHDYIWEDKGILDIVRYCDYLKRDWGTYAYKNQLFTADGELISKSDCVGIIYSVLEGAVKENYLPGNKNLSKTANDIYECLLNSCFISDSDISVNRSTIYTEDNVIIISESGELSVTPRGNTLYKPQGVTKRPLFILPVSYDKGKDMDTPYFDQWLNWLLPEEVQEIFMEYLGYLLIPDTSAGKMLCVCGRSHVGKSRINDILKSIFGDLMGLINIVGLTEKDGDREAYNLFNKLVVYDDEIQYSKLKNKTNQFGKLKTVLGNTQQLRAEQKYIPSFEFINYARLICASNSDIRKYFHDDDFEALSNRCIVLVTNDRPIPGNKIDLHFGEKIKKEKDGIFYKALLALCRYKKRGEHFPNNPQDKEYLRDAMILSDPIGAFIKECCITGDSKRICAVDELQRGYITFAQTYDLPYMSVRSISSYLRNYNDTGIKHKKRINGQDKSAFTGIDLKPEYKLLTSDENESKRPVFNSTI